MPAGSSATSVTGALSASWSFIQVADVVDTVRAATGWDVTVDELLEIGERAVNLARIFNVREGFNRSDDRLHRPLEGGPLTGVSIDRDALDGAITALYTLKGWDPVTGAPTAAPRALGAGVDLWRLNPGSMSLMPSN